jgi:hypothetical protein
VARNCSKRALMRPRPRRTLRRFREWLPCFFTQSFSTSLSRMSFSVRYDLAAPMRSFTWMDDCSHGEKGHTDYYYIMGNQQVFVSSFHLVLNMTPTIEI